MVPNQQPANGIILTAGHMKLAVFVMWAIGVLPLLTWLAIVQFLSVTYWQVFLPYVLLYGLLVTEEVVRGFIGRGQ